MDLTMESDAMSEISEISTAASGRSKKLRFRTSKKQKQEKDQPAKSAIESGSKSSSILSLNRRSGSKQMKSLEKSLSEELPSPTSGIGAEGSGKEEAAIRFSGQGVTFKAKLIGIDPVAGPRGDQMCKNAMTRLKAIVKGTGIHKKKILLSISLAGLRLIDEKSREEMSHHPIPLISYISRDTSDNRAFGFVYGSPCEGHQFIGIKTEKAAIPVMQTIADLFTFVYEKRKREKSLPKDNNSSTSSPSRSGETAAAAVLSFGSKEEFSTEKVNAAWTRTEPSRAQKSSGSPSTGILPLPLPPPKPSDSISSRTSTMNSMQRSDVLSELRSMRHVINSARDAASSHDNNNRYATWESFNENDTNDTISQMNSQVSSVNHVAHVNTETNRSASLRSVSDATEFSSLTHKSFNSPRLQHPGILPHVPLVPSPPSSPRSTSSRSSRPRRVRGIDQPNQVALPPVSGFSFSQATPASLFTSRLTHPPLQQMFPGVANSFPTHSEPDLFSDKNDKFEVNFDAVFSESSIGPSLPPPVNPTPRVATDALQFQTHAVATAVPPNTRSNDPNDRYACFQEIQNLETFPSIFDNPSSSSDSDTFVGSPPKSAGQSMIKEKAMTAANVATTTVDTDLFGSSNWTAPPQACAISFPPPLLPVSVNPHLMARRSSGESRESSTQSVGNGMPSVVKQPTANAGTRDNTILKDVATSPGTPPSLVQSSSHEPLSHMQETSSRNNSSRDPFSALSFKDLQPISGNQQHLDRSLFFQSLKNPPTKSLQELGNGSGERESCSSQASGSAVMTNRVGSQGETNNTKPDSASYSSPPDAAVVTGGPRDRPPSVASSVASSFRNPFAADDFEDSRSTHSESEAMYSSCPAPPAAFHVSQPTPVAGQMARVYPKHPAAASFHAMMSHRFDPFAFPHPATPFFPSNMSPAFEAQFQRQASNSQMFCHHHAGQMHPSMQSECDCRFFYRHQDPRVPDMYQHPPDPRYQYFQRMQQMCQQQQQQKIAPTEFGTSFEFDPEFESLPRGMDTRHYSQWGYPSHSHREQEPISPTSEGSRCLSPNNPFNPVFAPVDAFMSPGLDAQYGATPPRPPARINPDQQRRTSFEADAPPPPLPKRKMQTSQSLQHAYHNSGREMEGRNIYACPPAGQHQIQAASSVSDSPPPLPLPSRKKSAASKSQMDRRVSFDSPLPPPPSKPVDDPADPFNVAYIDKHLSQVSLNKHSNSSGPVLSSMEKSRKIQTSTPLTSTATTAGEPTKRPEGLHLSSIKSVSESGDKFSTDPGFNDSSVFESSSLSSGFDSAGYKRLQEDPTRAKKQVIESQHKQQELEGEGIAKKGPFHHFGEDHVSPPERNIFRSADPFVDDEFFAP